MSTTRANSVKSTSLKSDVLLLVTATIWGFAFVAQRAGMEFVGPFTFNAIRFALGALALVPFVWFGRKRPHPSRVPTFSRPFLFGTALAGTILFLGSTFQQTGIVYTTAGKAGFITGLYVILVPILGLALGHKTDLKTWAGALLAVGGLYFLSVRGNFKIQTGDLLVLVSAFFWASHVLVIDNLSPKFDTLRLALLQFLVCSILSLVAALWVEEIMWVKIVQAAVPILYAGVLSVGIAYTLQVVAQKNAHPSHAAIIMSLESVFAAVGGWLVLGEKLSPRESLGCLLMFTGMILSQLQWPGRKG